MPLAIEDRERIFRGALPAFYAAIPAVAAFIFFALGVQDHHPIAYAIAGALTALTIGIVFRWPRRIRIVDGSVEISWLGRHRQFSADELRGVWFEASHDVGVDPASVAALEYPGCNIELPAFRKPHVLWDAIEQQVFLPTIERIARELLDEREVTIGPFTLRRDGFTAHETTARWAELDQTRLRPEGYVIILIDRPQDAIVIRPGVLNPIPFLATIAESMIEADTNLDEPEFERSPPPIGPPYRGEAHDTAAPLPPAAAPPPGMPEVHPELGPIVFAYRSSLIVHIAIVVLAAASLSLLITLVYYYGVNKDHPVADVGPLITAGLFALWLGLVKIEPQDGKGSGRSFVVYRGGAADRRGCLRWRDVNDIVLSATRHYVNGTYEGENYDIAVNGSPEGRKRSFKIGGTGPRFEAYFDWFTETVLPRLARRDLAKIDLGESVTYAGVVVDQVGIGKGQTRRSWNGLVASIQAGKLRVGDISVDLNKPNGRLLLALIHEKSQRVEDPS